MKQSERVQKLKEAFTKYSRAFRAHLPVGSSPPRVKTVKPEPWMVLAKLVDPTSLPGLIIDPDLSNRYGYRSWELREALQGEGITVKFGQPSKYPAYMKQAAEELKKEAINLGNWL